MDRDLKHIFGNSVDRLIGAIKDGYVEYISSSITNIKITEIPYENKNQELKSLIHINVKKITQ